MPTYTITKDPATNAATVTCTCGEPLFTRGCRDDIEPRWRTVCPACDRVHTCCGRDDGDLAFDGVQERVRGGFAKPELAETMDVTRHLKSMYDAEGRKVANVRGVS